MIEHFFFTFTSAPRLRRVVRVLDDPSFDERCLLLATLFDIDLTFFVYFFEDDKW